MTTMPLAPSAHAADGDLLASGREHFVRELARTEASLAGANRDWLQAARREAMQSFARQGLPTLRHEDWKYTSVTPIAAVPFVAAESAGGGLASLDSAALASPFAPLSLGAAHRLVFVNGLFDAQASSLGALPDGVEVHSMRRLVAERPELVRELCGRVAPVHTGAFVALNAALWSDGAVIVARPGAVMREPLYLLFIGSAAEEPLAAHVRNLVWAGRESSLNLIEHYASATGGTLANTVTEVRLDEGASLAHCKLQDEALRAFHIGSLHVRQARDSRLRSQLLAVGGRLARSEIHVALAGPGAECSLDGLYATVEGQLIDSFTTIRHEVPHCTSRELYKGILGAAARAVWTGRIFVQKNAQKTSSEQTNKNLLLAESAHVETRPQLEIYADDVKCSHGAAIGRLSEDALFYLRARGIGRAAAQHLLTAAFASEVLASLPDEALKDAAAKRLRAGVLSGGEELVA